MDECIKRATARQDHPTIRPTDDAARIVNAIASMFAPPDHVEVGENSVVGWCCVNLIWEILAQGFKGIEAAETSNEEVLRAALRKLGVLEGE